MGDLGPFTGLGCALTALFIVGAFGGVIGFALFWFVVRPLIF